MFFGNTLKETQKKTTCIGKPLLGQQQNTTTMEPAPAPSKNLVAALLVPVEQPLRICLVRTSWCQFHAITSR